MRTPPTRPEGCENHGARAFCRTVVPRTVVPHNVFTVDRPGGDAQRARLNARAPRRCMAAWPAGCALHAR
eukprot:3017699-Prymnesium_polylepis.1